MSRGAAVEATSFRVRQTNATRAVHAALCKVKSGAAVSVALDRVRAPRVRPLPRDFICRRFHSPRSAARGSGGRAPPASSTLLGD